MTYCLAIALQEGLVFVCDSRTNAGIDQVSTYGKMHRFGINGVCQLVLLSAGNLATTQAVVGTLRRTIEEAADEHLLTHKRLFEAAEYVGRLNRAEQGKHADEVITAGFNPEATFILGGQIGAEPPRIYLIYPQGNFIAPSEHAPFLQLGEGKYGKPILDRIITPTTSLTEAACCALVSMDSTMRSNASVGPPIELLLYTKDALKQDQYRYFEADDPCLLNLRKRWDHKIKAAFRELLPLEGLDLRPAS